MDVKGGNNLYIMSGGEDKFQQRVKELLEIDQSLKEDMEKMERKISALSMKYGDGKDSSFFTEHFSKMRDIAQRQKVAFGNELHSLTL